MPGADLQLPSAPDVPQRSAFSDFLPSALDPVLVPPNNYVYPLPELPQSPPPPLQLAYIPPLSAIIYPIPPTMPEPPVLHKVWILDCRSCGKFLTNRGMKAVLLLRPNVPLYSTDAMPVNCSVYSAPAPRHSSRSSAHSSRTRTSREDAPRTCECLTQTLCCHGCGAQIGYMIVAPCFKCTSSTYSPRTGYNHDVPFMPPLNPNRSRATNGHRFVFHSSEVVGEERLYVSGEPGVIPDADLYDTEEDNTFSTPSNFARPAYPTSAQYGGAFVPVSVSGQHISNHPSYAVMPPLNPRSPTVSSASESQRFFHTFPPHNSGDSSGNNMAAHSRSSGRRSSSSRDAASPARSPPPHSRHGSHTSRAPSYSAFPALQGPIPPIHQYQGSPSNQASPSPTPPKAPRIRGGDVLFWHHLSRRGELPGVYDDERSRSSNGPRSSSYRDEDEDNTCLPGVGGAIVCGR